MALTTKEKDRLLRQYGPWAVVTGASSGIGLELAKLLAEAGLNLVIVGRRADKLHELEATLPPGTSTQLKVVAADVAQAEGIQRIIAATEGLEVGLLVASAGYGTSGPLLNNPLEDELDMLRVNCEAVLALAHHYGQRFVQQRRGGLILMSSLVAFQGVPYAANYAATKAYVQSLAEALALECKPHGVHVLAAAPGPVTSGFGQRANMRMSMSLTPQEVAAPILRALGRRHTVLPGWLSKLLVYSLQTVPRWAKVRIMAGIMGGMTQHQRG